MNSYRNNNTSSDRVDPKCVTPSRHSVFIRGFPSTTQIEEIRNYFKNETNENCKIDFFSYSDDRKKLFLALRFETHEKAMDVIKNFDNKEVLGHNIEVSWFKDLRKARKRLIEEERHNKQRDSPNNGPLEWSGNGSNNKGGRHSNLRMNGMVPGAMWSVGQGNNGVMNNRFMRNALAGMNIIPGRRLMSGSYMRGRNSGHRGWCRARLGGSGNRRRLIRRHKTRSHSRDIPNRSQSISRSRSRSRSLSHSSRERSRRSYSSISSRRDMSYKSSDASTIIEKQNLQNAGKNRNGSVGHDSIHKYRLDDDNDTKNQAILVTAASDRSRSLTRSISPPKRLLKSSDRSIMKRSLSKERQVNYNLDISEKVHSYRDASPSKSTQSDSSDSTYSGNFTKVVSEKSLQKHKKKIKKKNKKKKLNKRCKSSNDNSDSNEDQRCVTISKESNEQKQSASTSDFIENKANIKKEDDHPHIDFHKSLSTEDHISLMAKKESLEKGYKKDCETVASVAKLFISKNPDLEEPLLLLLKTLFTEIGTRYLEEFRAYLASTSVMSTESINRVVSNSSATGVSASSTYLFIPEGITPSGSSNAHVIIKP